LIRFQTGGQIAVEPVIVPGERLRELNDHLLLFYTGQARISSQVAAGYVSDLDGKKRTLETYLEMVREALAIVTSQRSLDDFGRLLHEAWKLKRSLSPDVSNDEIDRHYDTARQAGALGGKLLGAGGGGFLLVFAPPDCHAAIAQKLDHLLEIPFRFENSGSQVIFYERQIDYSQKDKARLNQTLRPFTDASFPGQTTH
jgi:D-glycero-alpha-D-manno-heptose-7-phosphate kinase